MNFELWIMNYEFRILNYEFWCLQFLSDPFWLHLIDACPRGWSAIGNITSNIVHRYIQSNYNESEIWIMNFKLRIMNFEFWILNLNLDLE